MKASTRDLLNKQIEEQLIKVKDYYLILYYIGMVNGMKIYKQEM